MNLVYLLTNLSKILGKRYYIGSKQESIIQNVDGVDRIIDKNGQIYNSSSTSIEFREDLKSGHIFEATLLEGGIQKNKLLGREEYYIQKYNAVFSDEYYNISNARLNCHDQDIVYNEFGETLKELSGSKSSVSKRDNSAKIHGFDNFGLFAFYIHKLYLDCGNYAKISRDLKRKDRHFASVFMRPFNMYKATEDLKNDLTKEVRLMYIKKASLHYISKFFNIELPVARIFLGDYSARNIKVFLSAHQIGLTKHELEIKILEMFLSGMTLRSIAKKLNIDSTSCKRYFYKYIRENLKINDL